MYQIQATLTLRMPHGYERVRQVPTFYVGPETGPVSAEHAARIAADIVTAADRDVHAYYVSAYDAESGDFGEAVKEPTNG